MFKRLRNRLLIFNMAVISLVMIAAFAAIYFITYTNIQKENQNKLESIPTLVRSAHSNPDLHELQFNHSGIRVVLRVPVDYSQSFVILVNSNGQMVDVLSYIDMPDEAYEQIADKTWDKEKKDGTISFADRKWQYRIASFEKKIVLQENSEYPFIYNDYNDVHYQIAFLDITDSSRTLTQLLITFVLVGFAMLFIIFGISFHFANRSIRPIEDSWQKQKQFIADASHELKTPLAIINSNTDVLLASGEETVNSQKRWISYIKSEAERMGKLINDMLYLAKVEEACDEQTPFDLSSAVLEVVASLEAVIFEKGISLTQTIEPGIVVKGDGEKIKQAVLILLDNAVKYTNDAGNIHITLKKLRNCAVFSVQNSGEGIPADKLPRIFDRFYRTDPSRSQETGGYGLGLAIAKAIIERSGGSIYAESTDSSTTFTFELKIN